jgi:hypothetical protein
LNKKQERERGEGEIRVTLRGRNEKRETRESAKRGQREERERTVVRGELRWITKERVLNQN